MSHGPFGAVFLSLMSGIDDIGIQFDNLEPELTAYGRSKPKHFARVLQSESVWTGSVCGFRL